MKKIQNEGKFMNFLTALLFLEEVVGEFNERQKNLLLNMISDPILGFAQKRIENKISFALEQKDTEFISDTIYYSSNMIRIALPFKLMIISLSLTLLITFLYLHQVINNILGHYLLLVFILSDIILFSFWLFFYRSSYMKLLETFHWFKKMMWDMTNALSDDLLINIDKLYDHRKKIEMIRNKTKENKEIINSTKELVNLEYEINTDLIVLSSELAANEYELKGQDLHDCMDAVTSKKSGEYKFSKSSGNALKKRIEKLRTKDLLIPRSKVINNHILSRTALIIRTLESLCKNTKKYEEILRQDLKVEEDRSNKNSEMNAMYEFARKALSLYQTDAVKAATSITLQDFMQWYKLSDTNINLHGDLHMPINSTTGDNSPITTGDNSPVISESWINEAFKIVSVSHDSSIAQSLLELEEKLKLSNSKEAMDIYKEFCKQATIESPNKLILKSLWNNIISLVPTIAQATTIVSNITKIFV